MTSTHGQHSAIATGRRTITTTPHPGGPAYDQAPSAAFSASTSFQGWPVAKLLDEESWRSVAVQRQKRSVASGHVQRSRDRQSVVSAWRQGRRLLSGLLARASFKLRSPFDWNLFWLNWTFSALFTRCRGGESICGDCVVTAADSGGRSQR